jgi:hypothetical protein
MVLQKKKRKPPQITLSPRCLSYRRTKGKRGRKEKGRKRREITITKEYPPHHLSESRNISQKRQEQRQEI